MNKRTAKTPIRRILQERSSLQDSVRGGMDAVKKSHRDYFDASIRSTFSDSLELDEAVRVERDRDHNQENRWDYLLGHSPSDEVIAVEPHSAKQDEITTVIRKRNAARAQLSNHLRDGARVSKWLWVASGRVQFADTEKSIRLLDQNDIKFVGTRVLAKHLPAPAAPSDRTSPRRRRKA